MEDGGRTATRRGGFPGPWRHRFALLTSASTLFLIFAGGLVTSSGSGLAVPDWPLSYGQFFPPMVGGVFYEHGHRMVAAVVGLLMLGLALWTWRSESRGWVRGLAAGALATVVVQALLGGVTVLYLLPPSISISHAGVANLFFALTVVLALVTGRGWISPSGAGSSAGAGRLASPDGLAGLPALAACTTGAVYVQILLGAVMRHTGAGLSIPDFPLALGRIVPPLDDPRVAIHFAHRVWGLGVGLLAAATVLRVLRRHRGETRLVRPALALAGLVAIQIALGAFTVWTAKQVHVTTFHVAGGSATLASALVLTLRAARTRRGFDPALGILPVGDPA